ncbi:MAG TPA: 30S ribosomal protein S6 [Smithellaceae bacterium]|nr:30S ribosomal protein S6 [Smithellaceae bacterium]HQF85276.1 30S ribosomal protein S6 [Smithellaceae bacterium]HQG81468.1 30S ribosomal protein S6 [Smithellaceae bacterium]
MKRYEVVTIVKVDLAEEEISAIIDKASLIITERKGIIAKAEKWGKRRLAYEINKQKDGFYLFIDYAGDGAIVAEMERNFKIDDRILKFLTVATSGAVTREGIDAEIAEAEARRSQAQAEPQAITTVEKPAKEEKQEDEPARKDAQTEANDTKGEQ